jgi:hypothetical protein
MGKSSNYPDTPLLFDMRNAMVGLLLGPRAVDAVFRVSCGLYFGILWNYQNAIGRMTCLNGKSTYVKPVYCHFMGGA